MKILIVKTSSLGDVIQSFPVLSALREKFPTAQIDWVVEESLQDVLRAHPLLSNVIAIPMKALKKYPLSPSMWKCFLHAVKILRLTEYDCVFDLQGNCKSGLWTFLSRAKKKVGFSFRSVREWPNVLATSNRFFISKEMPIQKQYLSLIEKYFGSPLSVAKQALLRMSVGEQEMLNSLVKPGLQVMVCPGSSWENKKLSLDTWVPFLRSCYERYGCHVVLVWGSIEEKEACEQIYQRCPHSTVLERKLSLPLWQNLMDAVDLVIALDSSALHLCATTKTPSFSIFGPTRATVFCPPGEQHVFLQGECPYRRTFVKQCPLLRTCATGACMKGLSHESLFKTFRAFADPLFLYQRL